MLVVLADLKSINKLHIWFLAVCDSVKFSFCSGIKNAGSRHSCHLQTKEKRIAREETKTQAEKETCKYLSGQNPLWSPGLPAFWLASQISSGCIGGDFFLTC